MVLMKKYINIKFNLDGELSLNKAMEGLFLMKKKHILATSFLRWMLKWIMKKYKMLYYDRIDVYEGIDVNKTTKCDICH